MVKMRASKLKAIFILVSIAFIPGAFAQRSSNATLLFQISFSAESHPDPITGRAYVIISRNGSREPRFQTGYTGVPIWGVNIVSLAPGETAAIDGTVFGYPLASIADIPPGEYYVQGFINVYTEFKRADGHTLWLHNDQWEGQRWNRSPGNMYSDVQKIYIHPDEAQFIALPCTHVIPALDMPADDEWVKRIKFQSKLLSEFWGQPIYLGATLLLPKGYEDHPEVYYPVNYIQGHFSTRAPYGFASPVRDGEERRPRGGGDFSKFWLSDSCPRMIAVTFQHPCPYYDDSYAVNSANVGPYDEAIMTELIPFVEERFRILREPYARLLSGGSTGGWICLALQIFHPDFFGGTWSLCPDPVDFRYYQIVNIYEDRNAYYRDYEWMRVERPNTRGTDGNIRSMMKDENLYELVIGDRSRGGGQWDIWEAAFGPIAEDGYPKPIWDKMTGEIDRDVALYWREHFDLRYYLEKNWSWLGPKLVGKLHIYTGSMDSFYLNNAVILLEEFLEGTENPYYDGVVRYGEREPHCWGPRGIEILKLFEAHISTHAPTGEDLSKWKY